MTIQETYIKFLEKVNKNYSNDNIGVDFGRFISIFNESQIKFVEWLLEKRNEDDSRLLHKIVVSNKLLNQRRKDSNGVLFDLPNDYFDFGSLIVTAKGGGCDNAIMDSWEAKLENLEIIYSDEFNEPSFKFRETFYTFVENGLKVYIDKDKSFDIKKVEMSYYRYPREVDIEGYIKSDGTYSKNIDCEFEDRIVNKILDICVKVFDMNTENLQKYQIDMANIVSKN